MKIRSVLIALLLVTASFNVNADCSMSPVSVEYSSTPPLLAHQTDSALVVKIHENGCVAAQFPRQDIRHGTWALVLGESDHLRLIAEIDAAGLHAMDPFLLRKDVAAKKQAQAASSDTFYRVSDENIIEFKFAAGATRAETRLRFSSLRDDLLNLPDHSALIGIASTQQLFEDLAKAAHEKGSQR